MEDSSTEAEARRTDLRAAVSMMTSPMGLGLTASVENGYLMTGALQCYATGADIGAVFCAHSSCERDLAAHVEASGSAPANSIKWGLGPLIEHVAKSGSMTPELAARLRDVNEIRKTLYHHGHAGSDQTLTRRTLAFIAQRGPGQVHAAYSTQFGSGGGNKEVWEFAMSLTLRQTALEAVTAALLVRSWLVDG